MWRQGATFLELLEQRAAERPEARAYTFLADGETTEEVLSYAQLHERARAIGGLLQASRVQGERVLLLFPPGLDYLAAVFGCIYAGAVAVPAYPPDPARLGRTLPRLASLVADAGAHLALTTAALAAMAGGLGELAGGLRSLRWIATEDADAGTAAGWRRPDVTAESVAFLQYTSGSTATPRGVILTHGNLMHNSAAIHRSFGHGAESRGVIWLPPYHDMGLIGGILQPLYGGFPVVLMSPLHFLAQPLRWLRAITRYAATTSGGPNFAYDLCARKVTPEAREGLDLSSWDLAFNGAEPIHGATLERFHRAFAPCGFRREAFYPCYGLAEGTLIAAGGEKSSAPVLRTFRRAALERNDAIVCTEEETAAAVSPFSPPAVTLVGCGTSLPDQELCIVDPSTCRSLPDDRIGEIWLRGPSVAHGYWNRTEETAATFAGHRADPADPADPVEKRYLRTGDLGFLHGGELFVTGRLKDLIILRGRNHYPHDIERSAAGAHPALRPGCTAAFAVELEREEALVVMQEVDTRQAFEPAVILAAIRKAIAEDHDLLAHALILTPPGSLPKTSSGKIQRRACKEAYLAGELPEIGREVVAAQPASTLRNRLSGADLRALPPDERAGAMTAWLEEVAAALLGLRRESVAGATPLVNLGLDSLRAVELKAALENELGVSVPLETLLSGVSCAHLGEQCLAAFAQASAPADRPSRLPRTTDLPLSPAQEDIWLAARLATEPSAYHIPVALRLRGPLRLDWLTAALEDVITRHEALRTSFPETEGRAQQRILPPGGVTIEVDDRRAIAEAQHEALVREVALETARLPFDLQRGPLFRVRLLRLGDEHHVLLFTVHHIVADGWSMGLLIAELTAGYAARQRGESPLLPELAFQYADYAAWQRRRLTGPHLERLLTYWKTQLAQLPAELQLPLAADAKSGADLRGAVLQEVLPQTLRNELQAACARAGVTPFMWLLAVFQTLLYRGTGQDDVPVGVAVLGRDLGGTERLIGNFIHMLVMRTRLDGDPSFAELLRRVRSTTLDALAHQELPFELLGRTVSLEPGGRRPRLFRAAFGMQNQPRERLTLPGLRVETLPVDPGVSRLDLTLWISETPEGLECVWTYATPLFDGARIQRLHERLVRLLEATLGHAEVRIAALPCEEAGDDAVLQQALRRLGEPRRRRGGERMAPKTDKTSGD